MSSSFCLTWPNGRGFILNRSFPGNADIGKLMSEALMAITLSLSSPGSSHVGVTRNVLDDFHRLDFRFRFADFWFFGTRKTGALFLFFCKTCVSCPSKSFVGWKGNLPFRELLPWWEFESALAFSANWRFVLLILEEPKLPIEGNIPSNGLYVGCLGRFPQQLLRGLFQGRRNAFDILCRAKTKSFRIPFVPTLVVGRQELKILLVNGQ